MRLLIASLLGLAVGSAAQYCPYADKLEKKSACPYAERAISDNTERAVTPRRSTADGKLGVMYMNRIAPVSSTLYVANADGSNQTLLLPTDSDIPFQYHANWSPSGDVITFTGEASDGNSDLYRVNTDGTGIETLIATPSFEDAGVLSPDGTTLAYVSTKGNYTANIWVMDIESGVSSNLTDTALTKGVNTAPQGHFRPAWSPDGEWIAFSSDRNTNWTGHSNGTGWEHTQTLSIYKITPNGTDFSLVVSIDGMSLGSPKWSPDGSRIAFYIITREDTYNAHTVAFEYQVENQIASVDVATGTDVVIETSGAGCKISPQYISADVIAYDIKVGEYAGLNYTSGTALAPGAIRNPSWSPDGTKVVYEIPDWTTFRKMEDSLYSWDSDYEYRFTDVFPTLSLEGKLAITQKQTGSANSSIVTSNPGTETNTTLIFDPLSTSWIDPTLNAEGLAGAFQPSWTSDGEWLTFGVGNWFFERGFAPGWIYRAKADGSDVEQLTNGTAGVANQGFPSYSPDGSMIVFREFGPLLGTGLRILNLTDMSITNLTDTWDNTPGWSPDGSKIVFTRRNHLDLSDLPLSLANTDSYDIYTIFPDGTDLTQLTTSGANDAHAVWTADGRIMYNSGMYGFRDECAIYDNAFQPYGQIMIMNADGSNKTLLTDSMWEDSMPLYVLNADL